MSEVKKYETVEEYLNDIFADEEFVRRVFEMDTPEEVQAALLEKGLEISIEGVMKLRDLVDAMLEKGGELSPEELDEVSGGIVLEGFTGALAVKFVAAQVAPVALAVVGAAVVVAALAFGIRDAIRRRW